MKVGKFELRGLSSNSRQSFAGMIALTIEETENIVGKSHEIIYLDTFPLEQIDPAYKTSINFAISLFLYQYNVLFINKHITISLTNLTIMPVDTTPVIMMYVTYQALLDAYTLADDLFSFDIVEGGFFIRKR